MTPYPEHSAWDLRAGVILGLHLGLPGLADAQAQLAGNSRLGKVVLHPAGMALKARDREAWGRGNHRWDLRGPVKA